MSGWIAGVFSCPELLESRSGTVSPSLSSSPGCAPRPLCRLSTRLGCRGLLAMVPPHLLASALSPALPTPRRGHSSLHWCWGADPRADPSWVLELPWGQAGCSRPLSFVCRSGLPLAPGPAASPGRVPLAWLSPWCYCHVQTPPAPLPVLAFQSGFLFNDATLPLCFIYISYCESSCLLSALVSLQTANKRLRAGLD